MLKVAAFQWSTLQAVDITPDTLPLKNKRFAALCERHDVAERPSGMLKVAAFQESTLLAVDVAVGSKEG